MAETNILEESKEVQIMSKDVIDAETGLLL